MDLYLIRHGESETNRDKAHAGWLPIPLTELGVSQAKAVGELLRGIPFDRFYCSDIYRTVQTFDNAFGKEQTREYCELLREINSGDLAGKSHAACAKEYGELYDRVRATWAFDLVGGENAEHAIARGAAFLKQMEQLPEDVKCVAAVSHGGLMRGIAAGLLHQPLGGFPLLVSNCGVCVLRLNRKTGTWQIVHWNVGGELAKVKATDGTN